MQPTPDPPDPPEATPEMLDNLQQVANETQSLYRGLLESARWPWRVKPHLEALTYQCGGLAQSIEDTREEHQRRAKQTRWLEDKLMDVLSRHHPGPVPQGLLGDLAAFIERECTEDA